jgi:predicted ATPase
MLTILAKAYARAEMFDEGLAQMANAIAVMETTGERHCEAELYRTKGELLRMQGADEAKVEEQFWKAVEVARKQSAKSWELRATMSMAKLWHHQGKVEPARALLDEIYGWFTEGFDSPDLREARALLDAFS